MSQAAARKCRYDAAGFQVPGFAAPAIGIAKTTYPLRVATPRRARFRQFAGAAKFPG
jgi:hypothetical protein